MNRASFLRSLTRTAAGLLIAPDALELLVEPRRKYWPGADFGGGRAHTGRFILQHTGPNGLVRQVTYPTMGEAMGAAAAGDNIIILGRIPPDYPRITTVWKGTL